MNLILILLGGCLFLVLANWLLELLVHHVQFGFALIVSMVVISAALGSDLPDATIGGFRVSPNDAIFGLVAGAALLRFLRLRRKPKGAWWLALMIAVAGLSLLRGIAELGLASPANEIRTFMRYSSAAAYAMSFRWDDASLRSAGRIYLRGAAGMLAVCGIRWAALFGGFKVGVLSATYDSPIRVLDGAQTFFLGQALILVLPYALQRDRAHPWAQKWAAVLALAVLLLNRRTVMLALLVTAIVLLIRNKTLRSRAVAIAGAVVGCLLLLSLLPSNPVSFLITAEGPEGERLAQSALRTDTLGWRADGWQTLLFEPGPEGPTEWLLGLPFGSDYKRVLSQGRSVDSNPHNYYLQLLLRVGLVGAIALLVLFGTGIRSLGRASVRTFHESAKEAMVISLVAQLVWFVAWSPGVEQGLLLGVAIALGSQSSMRERRQARRQGALPAL